MQLKLVVVAGVVALSLAACKEKKEEAPAAAPAATEPSAAAPTAAPTPAAAPSGAFGANWKADCDKLIPKDVVDKYAQGIKPVWSDGNLCQVTKPGQLIPLLSVTYKCADNFGEPATAQNMRTAWTAGGGTEVSVGGKVAVKSPLGSTGTNYDVIDDDTPCHIAVSWVKDAPANSEQIAKEIVAAAKPETVK